MGGGKQGGIGSWGKPPPPPYTANNSEHELGLFVLSFDCPSSWDDARCLPHIPGFIAVLPPFIDLYMLCFQGNVPKTELTSRPMELFMCSILKRQGYGEGFRWLAQYLQRSPFTSSTYLWRFNGRFVIRIYQLAQPKTMTMGARCLHTRDIPNQTFKRMLQKIVFPSLMMHVMMDGNVTTLDVQC